MRDITIGQYYPVESIVHSLDPRTKLMSAFLKGIGVERSALVLTAEPNEMLDLMVRNLPRVDSATAQEINPYAVLLFKNIVADKAGFDALMARAAGKETK